MVLCSVEAMLCDANCVRLDLANHLAHFREVAAFTVQFDAINVEAEESGVGWQFLSHSMANCDIIF